MPETELFQSNGSDYKLDLERLKAEILGGADFDRGRVVLASVIGDSKTAKSVLMNSISAILRRKDPSDDHCLSNGEFYQHVKPEAQHGPGCRIWEKIDLHVANVGEVFLFPMVSQVSVVKELDPNETKKILALISIVSSITILNVKEKLKEKDLVAAKDILEYSRLHPSGGAVVMIAIQKYALDENAQCYFENAIQDCDGDSQALKEAKKALRESKMKCYGFPNSKSERDPKKLPDLNHEFMTRVTDFARKYRLEILPTVLQENEKKEKLGGKHLTGKQLLRCMEELSEETIGKDLSSIKHSSLRKAVERAIKMVECERAFEDCLVKMYVDPVWNACKILISESGLKRLEEDAWKAAQSKANGHDIKSEWPRVVGDYDKIFEKYRKAGQDIRKSLAALGSEAQTQPQNEPSFSGPKRVRENPVDDVIGEEIEQIAEEIPSDTKMKRNPSPGSSSPVSRKRKKP